MTITKIPVRTVFDNSNNPVGLAEFQVGEVIAIAQGGTSANTVANARVNLNITDANIRSLFSVSGGGSYSTSNGVITIDSTDLTPFAKTIDLTTANVIELTNLYFTNTRSRESISVSGSISYNNTTGVISFTQGNTDTVVEGVSNLYFSNARAIGSLAGQAVSIGEATVTGNLFVLGNVVEFNTETLVIEDKNIVLANGAASAAVADGAGITIDGANATLLYISEDDEWEFNKDLSVQGSIAATGNITSPFFYSESDIALKEDVNPISNALKKVLKLTGVDFIWKTSKQKAIGVIAQDVEKILPEIVGKSNSGFKTIQYNSLIPLLIEAIKDQQKQIDDLRKKVK